MRFVLADIVYVNAASADVMFTPGDKTHFEFARKDGFKDVSGVAGYRGGW